MSYDNTNRGAIWGNRNKEKDTQPDYKGELNVDGVEFWVSAWKRKPGASDKAPALSFQVEQKGQRTSPANKPQESQAADDDLDSSIPF